MNFGDDRDFCLLVLLEVPVVLTGGFVIAGRGIRDVVTVFGSL